MSAKVLGQVWDYVLKPAEQAVLLALADHAHDDGTGVRPGVGRVVWKTGLSEATVHRVLRDLRRRGVLLETRRAGYRRPAEYRIVFGSLVRKAAYRPVHKGLTTTPMPPVRMGLTGTEMGLKSAEKGVMAVRPEPSSEPSAEPTTSNPAIAQALEALRGSKRYRSDLGLTRTELECFAAARPHVDLVGQVERWVRNAETRSRTLSSLLGWLKVAEDQPEEQSTPAWAPTPGHILARLPPDVAARIRERDHARAAEPGIRAAIA